MMTSLVRTLLGIALVVLGLGAPVALADTAGAVPPSAPSVNVGIVGYGKVAAGSTTVCQSPATNGGLSTAGSGNEYHCDAFDPTGVEHCTSTDNGDGTSSSYCTVTLTASTFDSAGWAFDHWSGDCSGTSTTCTVTVEESECDTHLHPPCHSFYDEVNAVARFRDTRTPVTTLTSGPTDHTVNWDQGKSATFGFGSDEAAEIVSSQCRHDDGAWQPCSSPATWSAIADGVHTFCARQADGSGLVSAPACRTWEQEVPISLGIAASPGGVVTDTNTRMTFDFSTNKTSGSYLCGVDDAALKPCFNPYWAPTGMDNGGHTLHLVLRFTPAAGFGDPVDSSPASYTWTQNDTTAPRVTFSLPSNQVATTMPALSYSIDDQLAAVSCTVDGTPVHCNQTGASLPATQGTHTLLVHVADQVGNADDFTWTWEKRPVAAPTPTHCSIHLAKALRHHRARFTVRCDNGGAGSLDATVKVGKHHRRLAAGAVHVLANRNLVVSLRIPKGTWKKLRRSHRYRATASLRLGTAVAGDVVRVHR